MDTNSTGPGISHTSINNAPDDFDPVAHVGAPTQTAQPLGMDDGTPPPAPPANDPQPAKQQKKKRDSPRRKSELPRNGAVNLCPYHGEVLKAGSTVGLFTYYYCPDETCGYSLKVPRPNSAEIVRRQREADEQDLSAR